MYGFREFDLWRFGGRLELRSVSGRPADYHGSAICNRHPAPALDCSCGYYAHFEPGHLDYITSSNHVQRAYLPAKVWGYGRVIEHSAGFRAELLRILYFIVPKCTCNQRLRLYPEPAFAFLGCPQYYQSRKALPDSLLQKLAAEYEAGIVMGEPLEALPEITHNSVN